MRFSVTRTWIKKIKKWYQTGFRSGREREIKNLKIHNSQ